MEVASYECDSVRVALSAYVVDSWYCDAGSADDVEYASGEAADECAGWSVGSVLA